MKCSTCGRTTTATPVEPYDYGLDCGGDCFGCAEVMAGNAVFAWCPAHDSECVVPIEHGQWTHLCSPHQCIEKQDIGLLIRCHEVALAALNRCRIQTCGTSDLPHFQRMLGIDETN